MQKQLVITLMGKDRVGIVDEVTKIVLGHGGNVDASRMARLEGEFAILMLVSLTEREADAFSGRMAALREQGYELSIRPTERGYARKFAGWRSCQIKVNGADHEGIIHEITHHLAELGVNIESMDTGMEPAPFGGTDLFTMSATVVVPPTLSLERLREDLEAAGDALNVDTEIVANE